MMQHIGFGTAYVSDDGMRPKMGCDVGQDDRDLRDWRRNDDDVCICQGLCRAASGDIDDAELKRLPQVLVCTIQAYDLLYGLRAFERQSQRAADQADAENEQFVQWEIRQRK